MENLREHLNVLTMPKFYDKYFHCLVLHTSDQLRIVTGRAVNTEKVERQLNFIKTITNATSNCQPSHVILNALIRLEVFNKLNNNFNETTLIELSFSKLC